MPIKVRSHMTKMHLPPPPVEMPHERHSWGFILVVLVFAVTVALVVYLYL